MICVEVGNGRGEPEVTSRLLLGDLRLEATLRLLLFEKYSWHMSALDPNPRASGSKVFRALADV